MKTFQTQLTAIVLVLAASICCGARAQDASSNLEQTYDTAPKPVLPITHCRMPEDSERYGQAGQVTARFTVTADGHVKDAHVVMTSGWYHLDAAVIRCISDRSYQPALKNGVPVAATLQEKVRLELQYEGSKEISGLDDITPPSLREKTTCPALANSNVTPPIVSMTIGSNGVVHDPQIKQSSGDPNIDKAALACAEELNFNPAMKLGQPIRVRIDATIK